jgi:hypothetical protein
MGGMFLRIMEVIPANLLYATSNWNLGSSFEFTDTRLCSILPTFQAKIALILKNECFLVTHIADYPKLCIWRATCCCCIVFKVYF